VSLILYAHPFSSYCQKVLIALYESAIPFELRMLSPDNPAAGAEFVDLWPLRRMPVLRDSDQTLIEGDNHHRASRSLSFWAGSALARRSTGGAARPLHGPRI
jgi:hypothetical protein